MSSTSSVPQMITEFHNVNTIISNFYEMINENLPSGYNAQALKKFVKSEIIKNDSDESIEMLTEFITVVIAACRV